MTSGPRNLGTHPDYSNMSLRGMEIAIPPGQTLPPPAAVGIYESKPLPPVPARRSMASSFSSEVSNAFKTPPKGSIDYQGQEASIAVILERDGRYGKAQPLRPDVRIDPARILDTPPDELLSPQPRKAVQKILRLTSNAVVATSLSPSPSLPTGHNPSQKIRQLMGIDVDVGSHDPRHVSYEVSPVSPMSGSSVYSEDLAITISEPDADSCYDGYCSEPDDGASSKWTSQVFESPDDVPASLRIQRPAIARYSYPAMTSPAETTRSRPDRAKHYSHRRESSSFSIGTDLYHATAADIAKASSTGNTHNSLTSPRKFSFSERSATISRERMAPPPEPHKESDRGGTSSNRPAAQTPYPPARSVFDDDGSDGADSPPRRSQLMRGVFRRRSVVELWSPSPMLIKRRQEDEVEAEDDQLKASTVIANGARRANGPDTPMPLLPLLSAERISGLMARVGVRSRAERRRVSLKSKIRLIPESTGSEDESEGGRRGR